MYWALQSFKSLHFFVTLQSKCIFYRTWRSRHLALTQSIISRNKLKSYLPGQSLLSPFKPCRWLTYCLIQDTEKKAVYFLNNIKYKFLNSSGRKGKKVWFREAVKEKKLTFVDRFYIGVSLLQDLVDCDNWQNVLLFVCCVTESVEGAAPDATVRWCDHLRHLKIKLSEAFIWREIERENLSAEKA